MPLKTAINVRLRNQLRDYSD